jgi:hypothetical protein
LGVVRRQHDGSLARPDSFLNGIPKRLPWSFNHRPPKRQKGLDDPETIQRLQTLKNRRQELESNLDYYQIRRTIPFSREQIINYLELNRNALYDRTKPAECEEVIDRFIEKLLSDMKRSR